MDEECRLYCRSGVERCICLYISVEWGSRDICAGTDLEWIKSVDYTVDQGLRDAYVKADEERG